MKLPRRRRSRASNRVKWSKISLVLGGRNHEGTSATTNEGGSRTRRTNKIVAIAEIKTRIGDRTRNHPNTTLPRPHRLTRMSQSLWTSTALGPLREEDA